MAVNANDRFCYTRFYDALKIMQHLFPGAKNWMIYDENRIERILRGFYDFS